MSELYCFIKEIIKVSLRAISNEVKYFTSTTKLDIDENKKYVAIFFAADYCNLGDVAITIAQYNYIKASLPGYEIIKIPVENTFDYIRSLLRINKRKLLVTLIGGGNNGNLYEFIECPRRFVLRKFRNYKIISFPQSVYYTYDLSGAFYRKCFSFHSNRCKDLTIVARECKSYEIYLRIIKANVLLTPDIVFSMRIEQKIDIKKENTIALIMRDDIEKSISSQIQENIKTKLIKMGYLVRNLDTCVIENQQDLELRLKNYIDNLRTVRFAVTDRLHGMILCYLTNTPCLVLSNNNHKILSTYKTWLSDQEGIIFLQDPNSKNCEKAINTLSHTVLKKEKDLSKEFVNLYQELKKFSS